MNKFFVYSILTLLSGHLFSQTLPKIQSQAKWQQKVDYFIDVTLNDTTQTLTAFEKIVYHNQSPDTITEIYIHLWPNAYKSRTTAYAKQELENGNTNFHFTDPQNRGWIDSLDFKVNGEKASWNLSTDLDIAVIKLTKPLQSGQSIEITTPFVVKIPNVFSRMGYEEGIYCITQWYPKPAVYDVNGWNPMPYLNQGEFYSEFGKFKVNITVPKEYLLAATGEVQDKKEKEWWLARSKNVKAKHFADSETKTLQFIQDSVHDFAWFCSKEFMSDKSEVLLSNGNIVETWIFAKTKDEEHKPKGIEYVNEAVKFYSEKVGNYPYSIVQVVITPLKAGGGMEYPTITNCASIDKTTIIHEVGHNWFYGILGSNERDYPWMDESFNTYYENRNSKENKKEVEPGQKLDLSNIMGQIDQYTLLYKFIGRKNTDQAGNLPSAEFTDNNYGAIVYAKNPLAFAYLQGYLGDEKFDAMMRGYYEKWKFKHPLPNDFKSHAEEFTQENLAWFFDGVLGSTQKLDYKMISAKNGQIKIKNNGSLIGPLPITQILGNNEKNTKWISGFSGTKTIDINSLNFPSSKEAANIIYRIDGNKQTTDLYRQNNTKVVKGNCTTCAAVKLQPIANLENDNSNQIFWAPIYAYNTYNKSMLGFAFYNSLFPQKKNEFVLMPVYSFNTNDVNGYANYWHNFYSEGKIRNIQVGFKSARFATKGLFYNSGDDTLNSYVKNYGSYYGNITFEKFAPFIAFNIKPKRARSLIEQQIELRYVMVNEQAQDRGYLYQFGSDHYGTGEVKYSYFNPNALYPTTAKAFIQSGLYNVTFNKIGFEWDQRIKYSKGKKFAEIRLFSGGFLFDKIDAVGSKDDYYSSRTYYQAGAKSGNNDFTYDEALIGREESLQNIANPANSGNTGAESLYGRQILFSDAGFRNFASVGSSRSFLSALNLTIPAPIPVPIGVYADFSYWQSPSGYTIISGVAGTTYNYYPSKMNLTYNGGIYVRVIKNVLSIYVPLISSNDVKSAWDINGYTSFFSRTSFVFNLNKINPISLIRDLKL